MRLLSSNEYDVTFAIMFLASCFFCLISVRLNMTILVINFIVVAILVIMFLLSKILVNSIIPKKLNLPSKTLWWFGSLEVHIGKKFENKFNFFKVIPQSILIAKNKGIKKVYFYTWHVTEVKIKHIFGESVSVRHVKGYERICNLISNKFYKNKNNDNPFIRVDINVGKVSDEFFNRWCKRIT